MTSDINNAEQPLNVLVVDDDELNRRMMQLILKREGHQVECASNGLEAVNAVKAGVYDIVLMDLQMPVMDGMEASRIIREWEATERHTFIVALTASYMPERGRELFEAGIDNYISKPFEIEHLRHILRYGLEQSKSTKTTDKPTQTEAKAVQPVFDHQIGLQRVGGDQETYLELLTDFIQGLSEKISVMRDALAVKDVDSLQRAAHNLKGVSANLGALELSEQARRLEKAVTGGYTNDSLDGLLSELTVAVDGLKDKARFFLFAEKMKSDEVQK